VPNSRNARIRDGELLASVDLGSNSFHLLVARCEHGEPRPIDHLREGVRLAAGLQADGSLDAAHRKAALQCLARFGQRLASIPAERVRAVATHTVRQLRAPLAFLRQAERALGHAIEVVSGREEARLIWQGVVHTLPRSRERRLVVDIGGGSSEFVVGRGLEPELTESVQIGCVASSLRFFPDGKITAKRWQRAQEEIGMVIQQFAAEYRDRGWREAWGASGTVHAVATIAAALGGEAGAITRAPLRRMRDAVLAAGSFNRIALPGMNKERRPIITGGIAIVEAMFDALEIEWLGVSDGAMREGLLWDMLGRAAGHDPRTTSIRGLAQRYGVDQTQARRVQAAAMRLFDTVAAEWRLDARAREWLAWAACVHEAGLAISHSQHHRHAWYILRHSDLAGFNTLDQQVLAAIVCNHRRKPVPELLAALPGRLREPVERVTALLRLAVLLCRTRDTTIWPRRVSAYPNGMALAIPESWQRRHPLTVADLRNERRVLREFGLRLVLEAR
jgi:exopolyphosphatase/guanosine-5'-triphosphate,3'-diphosphate pyrophosphatase